MSLDKKRIERDIFGDDDEDDEELSYNDRASPKETGDHDTAGDNSGAADADADAEQDDDEEAIQLPSFKKRNADGDSPAPEIKKKKITKKPKPAADSAEGDSELLPLDPRQQALLQLEKDFELAMKSGKSTTRRRRKDEEDIDTELDEGAQRFVAKMREAAFADIDAKTKNMSALAKVRMLESVKTQLNNLDIIQDFMGILDILPIQTDHLVNSGVGRVVFFYTKVDESRITPTIKRKAESLVDKWSRPIIKLSQDYRDKKISYADEDPTASSSQRRRPTASSAGGADAPDPKRLGVRVPQIDRGSYALMPESSIVYDKSRGGKSDKYKKLKSHMAKMKQVKRT
ncbi:Transcription factor iws1 [Mortierella alpina]|uniref:Transcription factor iws1 n=1 Tax=Mortierella alpina TaxID=64518 RepID=A0A9P6IZC7_MORAP|nr:Transcription factor iws1 [Mortierella alpina]